VLTLFLAAAVPNSRFALIRMPSPSDRLEPLPGYSPLIGRLVGMLSFARHTTVAAVEGLSVTELNIHYHYLDLVPKGRDEGGRGPYWVRRGDEYDR
jgi:hypothetical protein